VETLTIERPAEATALRVCTTCGEAKVEGDFYLRSTGGLTKVCKVCSIKRAKTSPSRLKRDADRKANRRPKVTVEETKARQAAWYQANKERQYTLHLEWNNRNRAKASGYTTNWQKSRPDLARDSAARYRARKTSRALLVTPKDVRALVARYSGLCAYCDRPYEHLDHVIPLSRGGWHSIGNLLPACEFCNIQKHSKTITEWRMWLSRRAA
jgi:5-methylcytosine-specific restriction endonuclease McrA